MNPDLLMAERFLKLMGDDVYTFQTFDDDKDRKATNLIRVLHGTFSEHKEELVRLNKQGAGIFFMVNCGDGIPRPGKQSCRTKENVTKIRAIFVDLDGAPLQPVLNAPHPDIVVETSPGKWHCYWITNDCPLYEFRLRQKQLAKKFNSDTSVNDLPRVLRLPGFFHQKNQPFMSTLTFP